MVLYRRRVAYVVGHFLNDLCSAVWFTYTLVFFQYVNRLSAVTAGGLILIGQVADGLATPFVGYFCDKTQAAAVRSGIDTHHRGHGRLRWHLSGSVLVIASFAFIYSPVYIPAVQSDLGKYFYYAFFIVLFQVGWASVQISHLALVNDLTADPGERVLLISWRYFFTVFANLTVYLSMFGLLETSLPASHMSSAAAADPDQRDDATFVSVLMRIISGAGRDFGPADASTFRVLAYVTLGLGAISTAWFHLGLRSSRQIQTTFGAVPVVERTPLLDASTTTLTNDGAIGGGLEHDGISNSDSDITEYVPVVSRPLDWFREPLFLILCPVYMFARLTINISQIYITLYLLESLLMSKHSIALIPLTIYVISAITSILQKLIFDRMNREATCCLGIACVFVFSFICLFPGSPEPYIPLVYVAAAFLGVGCTILLVSSLAMVGDLVGGNQSTGAFVYGLMSLMDKIANGLVVQIAQSMHSRTEIKPDRRDRFYQYIESYGIMGFVGMTAVLLLNQCAIRRCQRNRARFVPGSTIVENDTGPPPYGSIGS